MFDFSVDGKRVRLLYTSDLYTRLKPGDEGVAQFIGSHGTLFVRWDSGSRLGLIPGEDRWEFLEESD